MPPLPTVAMANAIKLTAERLVDMGESAKVATLKTDELIGALKAADSEIASFDALRDQDVLLDLLRRESEPSSAERDLAGVLRRKQAAIEAQQFDVAARWRDEERRLRANVSRYDADCIARLRINGLVDGPEEDFGYNSPVLTDAGRRLATSLL